MQPDVVFTVVFKKDGSYLASPTVAANYGREVIIEIPNAMRAVVLANAPNEKGQSFTSAKLAVFQDGAWREPEEMTMDAYLSMTPSFEYTVPDSPYRFVVMPRRIVPDSSDDQYLAVGETGTMTTWKFG